MRQSASVDRVCIIGAGSSGIAACQVLKARGIPFDCFEKGSYVGGNWKYMNDNGMSSSYRSLFINTSRKIMEYRSYPMPESLPDYPHHTQIQAYFEDFVDHFGLRERITFNTEVTQVEKGPEGWHVTTADGETRTYAAVMVANGHHWDPKWPDFPGEFHGEVMHAHDYKTPEGFEGKNVLVLGIGNSAVDIAVETSRVSKMTYLATRRGAWVIPKYLMGKPVDEIATPVTSRLPWALQRKSYEWLLKMAQGDMEDYGLPKPDHHVGHAHPTVSSDLLPRIGHGRIKPKPVIERLEGDSVRFADGSVEQIDRIVYATGYKITFPFLSRDVMDATYNRVALYRRVVHPDHPGLYFMGLIQPLGAIMPIAELQSEWVADLVTGVGKLPPREEMREEIAAHEEEMRRRYVASTRHTVQVDFWPYLRTLEKERKQGRRRTGAGFPAVAPKQAAAEPAAAAA